MKKKITRPELVGFHLVKGTSGIITNGVYIKDDGSELKILFAWGDSLHFRPLKDDEKSL